jgi:hypothetical protein
MTTIGHPATVAASPQALDGSIQNFIVNPEPNSVWLPPWRHFELMRPNAQENLAAPDSTYGGQLRNSDCMLC